MRLRLSWRSSMFGEKLTQSLIYKPISSPSLSPPSDPSADLAAVRPTCPSRLLQTHPPICGPLPLSFSQSISPSPFLTVNAYFWGRLNFFCYVFFVDLVYIFRFPIIIFKPTHLKSFSFLKNIFTCKYFTFWNHFTLSQIWISGFLFLFLFVCSSVFLFYFILF